MNKKDMEQYPWTESRVHAFLLEEYADGVWREVQDEFWRTYMWTLRNHQRKFGGELGDYAGELWMWAWKNPHRVTDAFNKVGWLGVRLRMKEAVMRVRQKERKQAIPIGDALRTYCTYG